MLHDRQTKACIPHKRPNHPKGKYPHDAFRYDRRNDCFICLAGKELPRRGKTSSHGVRYRYWAKKGVCSNCELRSRCSDSKHPRRVSRNVHQDYVDWADGNLSPGRRRHLMSRRKSKVEGSFADSSNCHRFKRARWRGLAKMTIQNLLVASAQNLRKLVKSVRPRPSVAGNQSSLAAICGGNSFFLRFQGGLSSLLARIVARLTVADDHASCCVHIH